MGPSFSRPEAGLFWFFNRRILDFEAKIGGVHEAEFTNLVSVHRTVTSFVYLLADSFLPFQVRPHILIMNKTDLAEKIANPTAYRAELVAHSGTASQHLSEVYFTQLNSPERQKQLLGRLIRGWRALAASDVTHLKPTSGCTKNILSREIRFGDNVKSVPIPSADKLVWMVPCISPHLEKSSALESSGMSHTHLFFFFSLPKLARRLCVPSAVVEQLAPSESPQRPTILTMAVGIPNSGKSTLINALRSVSRSGSGGAARVGRLAGQTRAVGQPIVISRGNPNAISAHLEWWTEEASSADFRIMILDTPGILEPRVRSLCEQLSLCVCGAVDSNLVDQELLVDYLLFWWNYRGRSEYVSVLGLPHPTDNVVEVLARVCAQNAFFLNTHSKHAVSRGPSWQANEIESLTSDHIQVSTPRPDLRRAAAHILRLFDRGAFGRTTFLPSDEEAASNYFILATR
ncbi:mitochondrial GTPase 1 [Paragonimus westermani]|uniref:Mitochondrial GTPase 1 n=1 Tax=Paragonimus westermani TaxID=34504 RepID=A0A5J4NIR1_9TREM|nr:mitochondrial GTPase 1 [Paragonimus westermani]